MVVKYKIQDWFFIVDCLVRRLVEITNNKNINLQKHLFEFLCIVMLDSIQNIKRRNTSKTFMSKCKKGGINGFQPYDWAWGSCDEVHDKWTKATSTFFKDFQCYAICGVTKLLHVNKKYWSISNQNIDDSSTSIGPLCTPYELANMYLSKYITNVKGNVMHLCMKCYMN